MLDPRVLQLCDSAFPSGAFSHSFGLETAVAEGRIGDAAAFTGWLSAYIERQRGDVLDGRARCFCAARPRCDARARRRVERVGVCLGGARRDARAAFVRATLDAFAAMGLATPALAAYREALASGRAHGHHALVLGLGYAAIGATRASGVRVPQRHGGRTSRQVAARAVPLGQRDARRVLWETRTAIEARRRRCVPCGIGRRSDVQCLRVRDRCVPSRTARRPDVRVVKVVRVGIGGSVGARKDGARNGLRARSTRGIDLAVVTNDIYTQEDAQILTRSGCLPAERIVGVETGGCPHTAIREDASMNLAAIDELEMRFPGFTARRRRKRRRQLGGDVFSLDLADVTIYVIDVAGGDKIPAKGGPGISHADLLVINKIDLAPHVGADLERMRRDATLARGTRPFVFSDLRHGVGVEAIVALRHACRAVRRTGVVRLARSNWFASAAARGPS